MIPPGAYQDALPTGGRHPRGRVRSGVAAASRGRLAPLFASLAWWSDAHPDRVEEARREYDALGRPSSS